MEAIKLDTYKKQSLQINEKFSFGIYDGLQSPSFPKLSYQNEETLTSASNIYLKNKIQNQEKEIKEEQEQRLKLQTVLSYLIDKIEDHELLKQKVEELRKSETFCQIQYETEEPDSSKKSVVTNKTYNTNVFINSVEYFIQSGLSKYVSMAQSNYNDQKRTKQNSSIYSVFASLKICKKKLQKKINEIQEQQIKLNQIQLQNIEKDKQLQDLQDKFIELKIQQYENNKNQQNGNLIDIDITEKYTQRLTDTILQNKQLQIENQSITEQYNQLQKQFHAKEQELCEYENLIKMQNVIQQENESEIQILQVKCNQIQELSGDNIELRNKINELEENGQEILMKFNYGVLQKEELQKQVELLNDKFITTNEELLQLKKENNQINDENRKLLNFQGKKQLNYDYKAEYQDILENKVQKNYEKIDQQQIYISELEKQKQQFQNKFDLISIDCQIKTEQIQSLQYQIGQLQQQIEKDISDVTQKMKTIEIYDLVRMQQNNKPRREQCQIIIRQNKYKQYLVQIESEVSSIMINGLEIQYLKLGKSQTDFKLVYTNNGERLEDVYESDNVQKLKQICRKIKKACEISEEENIQQDVKTEENDDKIEIMSLLSNHSAFFNGSK